MTILAGRSRRGSVKVECRAGVDLLRRNKGQLASVGWQVAGKDVELGHQRDPHRRLTGWLDTTSAAQVEGNARPDDSGLEVPA